MAAVSFYINNAQGQHIYCVALKSAVRELVDVTHMVGTYCKVTHVSGSITHHTLDRLSSITVDRDDEIEGSKVGDALSKIQRGLTQRTCTATLTDRDLVILTGQTETAS